MYTRRRDHVIFSRKDEVSKGLEHLYEPKMFVVSHGRTHAVGPSLS